MITKFSKQELERLGRTPDEIGMVMKYQKKLPILVSDNTVDEFSINARLLWEQLDKPQGDFSHWIKRKIVNKVIKGTKIKMFSENVDFIGFDKTVEAEKTNITTKEYSLTIDCAKGVAMMESTESGNLCRKYFMLMECIVQENKEWLETRDPEKLEYKNMCEEINSWNFRIWHKQAGRSDYAVEANGLNKIVTGLTSQELKIKYGCPTNDLVRDYLKKDHNEELLFLEQQNQVLLRMDMGYTERMTLLTKMHEVTFKKANTKIA